MENHSLQNAFLNACLARQVFSIRNDTGKATPLCSRTEINAHIPAICLAMGVEVENQDIELLLTPNGILNEGILECLSTANRSTLMVAMTAITVRYHRSTVLPTFETVDWIRKHLNPIKKQRHQTGNKPHWLFLDWYTLVNANVFVHIPVPATI